MSKGESQFIVSEKDLSRFFEQCLQQNGMDNHDAGIVAQNLIQTDKWGVYSHGSRNLYSYIKKSIAGGVSFTNKPEIINRMPSVVLIDGHNTMGFVSSNYAMECACDLAEKNGIGMAIVGNSCHFGAAGCYSNIAARRGMIGGAFSNVDPFMTIPGALKAVMGQNPMSLAAPASVLPSLFLDISTSNVASLRVVNAKNANEKIPKDWIIDKNGRPTDDPSHYPDEGALQPMAMHKGYGIALFIEVITSVISAGLLSMSGEIPSWNLKMELPNRVSHSFIAINPDKMMGNGYTRKRIDEMIELIHNSPKADGVDRLYVPGEMEWERSAIADSKGISLPKFIVDDLISLSDYSHIPFVTIE